MVSMLHRKLFRDLLHMRGQAIAIGLIVVCGVSTWVTMRGAYESLVITQREYYERYRFADVFVTVKRAPEEMAWRIRTIPGVGAVRTRVVAEVTVDVPNLADPASARILSVPPRRVPMLNDLHIRTGRYIDPDRPDEVLASAAFAKANHLAPGDSIGALINGRWRKLEICGTAMSPEYVVEERGGGFPDHRRFGVLWMHRDHLAAAMGMTGSFNDLSVALAPKASAGDVVTRIDRVLAPYGGLGAYGRDEQVSHLQLSSEIAQDRVTATTIPAIFLAVAAFLIQLVLARLVASQRDQIATLKAFGYSNGAVATHYLELALVIVSISIAVAVPVGIWLGRQLTAMYTGFFDFPVLNFRVSAGAIALSAIVTLIAGAAASIGAVRRVIALPPAEGMRGEAPPRYGRSIADRWAILRAVSPPVRMVVRTMQRMPFRTALSVAGLAMAAMILVVGQFAFDSLEAMISIYFRGAQTDDATVLFTNPRDERAAADLRRLPGVTRVEGFRAVPVRMSFGHRSRRVVLTGLEQTADLRRLVDARNHRVDLPLHGLVLTRKLADILGAAPGDRVIVEAQEGARPRESMPVAATVDELVGTSAYMSRQALSRFMRESPSISGANLAVDRNQARALYDVLKHTPAVATVFLRDAMLASFRNTVMENIAMSATMIVAFACIIAFGIIYNGARIALSERGRDLASLRVLGFTNTEVSLMLIGEQVFLTLVSLPIGFIAGRLTSIWIAAAFESEVYRLPVVISGRTYAISFLIIAAAAAFSAAVVQRRIRTLDLVEVLKTRE